MFRPNCRGHLFKEFWHHAESVVFGKYIMMVLNEGPVEGGPGILLVTLWVVRHFFEVAGTADVWLRSETSAVGKLAHTVDIWHHDPIICVDVHSHKPAVDFVWVRTGQEEPVT